MNDNEKDKSCLFCDYENVPKHADNTGRTVDVVDCPRCGVYYVSFSLRAWLKNKLNYDQRILFSGYLRNRSDKSKVFVGDDVDEIKDISDSIASYPVSYKRNKLIQYIGDNSPSYSSPVLINPSTDFTLFYLKSKEDLIQLIEHLSQRDIVSNFKVTTEADKSKGKGVKLSLKGWEEYEKTREEKGPGPFRGTC